MKKLSFILLAAAMVAALGCRKNYECKAVDPSGKEITLTCENCTKSDATDYEKEILSKGYTSVSCDKK